MKNEKAKNDKVKTMKPKSAKWNVWVGPEVEGKLEIGDQTLFVRKGDFEFIEELAVMAPDAKRIWFCAEFKNWALIKQALRTKLFKKVCVEVIHGAESYPPKEILQGARIYLKVSDPVGLKQKDHICVGRPYNDTAFVISEGARTRPSAYRKDKKLK